MIRFEEEKRQRGNQIPANNTGVSECLRQTKHLSQQTNGINPSSASTLKSKNSKAFNELKL